MFLKYILEHCYFTLENINKSEMSGDSSKETGKAIYDPSS